jgi:hypothetical protein
MWCSHKASEYGQDDTSLATILAAITIASTGAILMISP